jgi:hypothetical protein
VTRVSALKTDLKKRDWWEKKGVKSVLKFSGFPNRWFSNLFSLLLLVRFFFFRHQTHSINSRKRWRIAVIQFWKSSARKRFNFFRKKKRKKITIEKKKKRMRCGYRMNSCFSTSWLLRDLFIWIRLLILYNYFSLSETVFLTSHWYTSHCIRFPEKKKKKASLCWRSFNLFKSVGSLYAVFSSYLPPCVFGFCYFLLCVGEWGRVGWRLTLKSRIERYIGWITPHEKTAFQRTHFQSFFHEFRTVFFFSFLGFLFRSL